MGSEELKIVFNQEKLDLITDKSVGPYLLDSIAEDLQVIYYEKNNRFFILHILDATKETENFIDGVDKI